LDRSRNISLNRGQWHLISLAFVMCFVVNLLPISCNVLEVVRTLCSDLPNVASQAWSNVLAPL